MTIKEMLSEHGRIIKLGDFTLFDRPVKVYRVYDVTDRSFLDEPMDNVQITINNKKNPMIFDSINNELYSITLMKTDEKEIAARIELYKNKEFCHELQDVYDTVTTLDELSKLNITPLLLKYSVTYRRIIRNAKIKMCSLLVLLFTGILLLGLKAMLRSTYNITALELNPIFYMGIQIVLYLIPLLTLCVIYLFYKANGSIDSTKETDNKNKKIIMRIGVVYTIAALFIISSACVIRTQDVTYKDQNLVMVTYLNGSKKHYFIVDSVWVRDAGEGFHQ